MKKIETLIIPILFILLFVLVIIAPYRDSFTIGKELYINEVMAANKTTYLSKSGKHYDYIELYNNTDKDINLENYYLSDSSSNTRKYKLPNVVIKAKDYLVVFASGLNKFEDGEIHTNFKISSHGEVLILTKSDGTVINKLLASQTLEDTSYGYDGNKYVYYYTGTPGAKNSGSTSSTPINKSSNASTVSINEYILDNSNKIKSKDEKYHPMIELYNDSNEDFNLNGFYLSDDMKQIDKYKFGDITIKAKSYLTLYLNSESKVEGETHITFNLENKDTDLYLSDSNKKIVDKVKVTKLARNITAGKYKGMWQLYKESSFGEANKDNYLAENYRSPLIINEVAASNPEAIELRNRSEVTINLSGYSIGDKSGKTYNLPNVNVAPNGYYQVNSGAFKFGISTTKEVIYLYKDSIIEDTFNVGKLKNAISTGYNDKNEKVYFREMTFGRANSSNYLKGIASEPVFNIDGGYVNSGTKVEITSPDGGEIHFTLDGSFPSASSQKYTGPITITKNTVVKAINYKNGYIESDTTSRTFFVGRKHSIAVVSLTSNPSNFYGSGALFTNYKSVIYKKVDVEFYEPDGSYGTSFPGEVKLSGNIGGSRDKQQKAMTVYLRKKYGTNKVEYPLYTDSDITTYSSILFRNGGEDYLNVHIFDAALQKITYGEMDLDMQNYRPVALYINGSYYGISNMRDKLNSDYAVNKYGVDKNTLNVVKYSVATKGSSQGFRDLVNYIKTHDVKRADVYNYIKSQLDVQEVVNYWIMQSFYGNTDLGNIKYWKAANGKWRFMLYDIDWSLLYPTRAYNYPVANVKVPAATYYSPTIEIVRILYKNPEFRALYLSSFGKYLKTTLQPARFNKIVDDMVAEIESEVPYHTQRWNGTNSSLGSVASWKSHVAQFKSKYNARYNYVKSSIRTNFSMSDAEYRQYFG